jgi:alpha-glucosidase (family GH31 glycosyl hydrolase)
MNEPANLLEDSPCIGEVANSKECTKDKNKFYYGDLPYLPGYKKHVKETLSMKSINENAIVYGNRAVYDVKPLISFYQTKYTYEYLDSKLEIRPFVLSRSTSIGSGKYTYHWLGDNFSRYDNIKFSISGIFNFNIFGIPFTGSDICGFMENASKELCIRWYNLGAFYPFSRNHNFLNAKEQYPWSFDDGKNDTINKIKKSINIRYSLLRYMYSQFFLISLNEKGSFFKPVMFEFPEDEASYEDIESKIMFGESFLTVAFYEENENNKKIEFPDDNFNIYPSGKSIIKGEKVEKGEKMKNNNISSNNSTNEEEEEEDREIDRYRYGEP